MEINKDIIIEDKKSTLDELSCKKITKTGTDLNNYKTTGFYEFDGEHTPLNIPSGVNGWLQVISGDNNNVKQIWTRWGTANSNDYNTWVRTYISSAWSSWRRLVTDSDIKNYFAQQEFTKDNVTVDATNHVSGSFSIAKSGYTPIAVSGFFLGNASSGGSLSSKVFWTRASISGTTFYYQLGTYSTTSPKVKIHAKILFVKNND